MSINKLPYESGFEMCCDGCSYSEEFETGANWKEFIEDAKEAGWKITKHDNEWLHYCEKCFYDIKPPNMNQVEK